MLFWAPLWDLDVFLHSYIFLIKLKKNHEAYLGSLCRVNTVLINGKKKLGFDNNTILFLFILYIL